MPHAPRPFAPPAPAPALQANLAVAVNERLEYSVVESPAGHGKLLVAKELGNLAAKLGLEDGQELGTRHFLWRGDCCGYDLPAPPSASRRW